MADLKDAIEGIKKTIEDAVASGDLIPRADAAAAQALLETLTGARDLLLAVENAINEPPRLWATEPMDVRDYRHHLYRIWTPLCSSISAAIEAATLAAMTPEERALCERSLAVRAGWKKVLP